MTFPAAFNGAMSGTSQPGQCLSNQYENGCALARTGVETACAMDAQCRNFLAGCASGTESSHGDRGHNHACKLLKILTVRAPTIDGHTPVKRRDHEVGCRLAIHGR